MQWGAFAVIAALGVAAYANSMRVPFLLDDVPAIRDNGSISDLTDLGAVLWPPVDGGVTVAGRPVLNLSFAVNRAVAGDAPHGYHVVNLAIHLMAGLALFGVVRRALAGPVLRARSGDAAHGIGLAAASVWLVHPLLTGAVTYTVQRAESLAGLFCLLTLYCFFRATDSGRAGRWQVASVAACLLGMGTKETVASAPLIVLLADRTFVTGCFAAAWRARWRYYSALGATWLVLAVLVAGNAGRGGTAGFGTIVTPWTYLLTQSEGIVRYLALAAWPVNLVFDYGTETAAGLGEVWPAGLFVIGLLGTTLWCLKRYPAAGFVGACFFVILAPSSSIVPVASQTIAEHRMYLPLAALVAGAIAGLHRLLGRNGMILAVVPIVMAGTALTTARNRDYASPLTLWADTVEKRPRNPRAHHNLGMAKFERGLAEEAVAHYSDSIELAPRFPEPHYNMGIALARLGRHAEAIESYHRALALQPNHPHALNNLGNALAAAGRPAEAERRYLEAIRLNPENADAYANYGLLLLNTGRPADALAQCEAALRIRHDHTDALHTAGTALAALGRMTDAAARLRRAAELSPNDAAVHNNLGNVLLELDRPAEAAGHYETALRLDPGFVDPRRNLALLFMHLGRYSEARTHLEVLARRIPDDPDIAQALKMVRSRTR